MNLPKIQALAAPLSAPIPSALGVAAEAYNYMSVQSIPFWGWVAAVGAFVGIETMGGASCYALVKLHRERNYGVEFALAFVGILVYIGSGWYTLSDSPMIIFFFLAPFSYFAYSILRSMEREIEDKVTETEAQIALINAETKRINAETRKAKAGAVVIVRPVQGVNEQPEQPEQGYGLAVFAILNSGEQLGPRAMSRRLGCSVSTAKTHIDRWKGTNPPAAQSTA